MISGLNRAWQRNPVLTEAMTRAFVFADASAAAEVDHVGRLMDATFARAMSDGEPTEDQYHIARVICDVWLSNLLAWLTRTASATDVSTRLETLKAMPALVVLDRLPVPTIALEADGAILFANEAFAEMLGHTRQSLLSPPFTHVFRTLSTDESDVLGVLRARGNTVVELAFHEIEEGVDLILVAAPNANGRLAERDVANVGGR